MKSAKHFILLIFSIALPVVAIAQATSNSADDGRDWGGYRVQQSSEFGYRFTDVTGSDAIYSTFINQDQGPRLLNQSLSMRAPENGGFLFDDFNFSSFGWGGDPENVARLRVSKFKDYELSVTFRRDHNYFDYNLLSNPLNPSTSNPSIPVNTSPSAMYTTRRMYDFDLKLLPQSWISFRLGESHNRSEGPSYSSIHEGTDALLNQGWNVTENLFRFGVDMKVLKKTTLSYDQLLDYGKNDTDYSLASFATFLLPNGAPVELGLPFNTAVSQPCAMPIKNGAVNPACSAFFEYLRNQRVRTTTPTEQLHLISSYWQRVNIVGQASYSNTDMTSPYFELFNGLARNGQRQNTFSGPATARRVDAEADLGVTVAVTHSLTISDTFRYDNWHIPGSWASVATSTVGIPVGTPPTVTLLSPLGATTTTQDFEYTFLGMRTFYNSLQVEYSPDRHVGMHVGYKLNDRRVFHADTQSLTDPSQFTPFDGDTITSNQQGPTMGIWWLPIPNLRVNIEAEALTVLGCAACSNADQIFITRIDPRQQQHYRGRVNYKPVHWANLSSSVNWWEARNGEVDTKLQEHTRNAGFALSLIPNERLSVDLNYNYSDILQNSYICYNGTYLAPGTTVNGCPTFSSSANNNPNWIYSGYGNNTHYGEALVMFKPVKRLTADLGYKVTRSGGDATILNPLQPFGTLQSTYHQPLASLSFDVAKGWSANAYWNYDQYNEDSFVGPTAPRYFHDNRAVLSMKYAF